MPRKEIDYSHTIIYKITCKDENVKDVYVGHTTNFVQRKIAHKISSVSNQCKVYKVIRENGGWTNWKMEMVNFYNCKDQYEARIKEQEYFISLNATMNSIEPFPNKNISVKEKKIKKYGEKDNRVCDDIPNIIKTPKMFTCEQCHVTTNNKKDYGLHLLTAKHLKLTERHKNILELQKNPMPIYSRECGNTYKYNSGLWRHSKICKYNSPTVNGEKNTSENIKMLKSIVLDLIKSNSELQKQIIDVIEKNS